MSKCTRIKQQLTIKNVSSSSFWVWISGSKLITIPFPHAIGRRSGAQMSIPCIENDEGFS